MNRNALRDKEILVRPSGALELDPKKPGSTKHSRQKNTEQKGTYHRYFRPIPLRKDSSDCCTHIRKSVGFCGAIRRDRGDQTKTRKMCNLIVKISSRKEVKRQVKDVDDAVCLLTDFLSQSDLVVWRNVASKVRQVLALSVRRIYPNNAAINSNFR